MWTLCIISPDLPPVCVGRSDVPSEAISLDDTYEHVLPMIYSLESTHPFTPDFRSSTRLFETRNRVSTKRISFRVEKDYTYFHGLPDHRVILPSFTGHRNVVLNVLKSLLSLEIPDPRVSFGGPLNIHSPWSPPFTQNPRPQGPTRLHHVLNTRRRRGTLPTHLSQPSVYQGG